MDSLGPNLGAFLAKSAAGIPRDKNQPSPEEVALARLEEDAHAIRKRRLEENAVNDGEKRWDWAKSYETWDDWIEEEVYQEKQLLKKEKEARMIDQRPVGGCSHDHSAEREIMEKSTKQKIQECNEFRQQGNAWFLEGQYFRASERYRKVQIWLDYTFAGDEEEEKEIREVHLPALVNMTICCLKLKDYPGTLENARQALDLDPENVKALYCRARASRMLDDLDSAAKYLKQALELDPDNFELKKEAAFLRNYNIRYKDDTIKRAKAMFGGASGGDRADKKTPKQPDCRSQKDNTQPVHPLLVTKIDEFDEFANLNDDEEMV
mmetsp:Transcript_8890/g.14447  ORF Transcript_8890/g.14447 Transcript_8890/m.14447 type:complete len:322 (+) Transcript_8890:570-1535(+)|eukprot:CAMPEP_0203765820 /NCGR_PEP_ID=MMETSP0099_2-20121227/76_1 /ASSEMBLY_ACC=CAM_ASM_000209 /TAXON_ID=96639 /ORGANISM=" , Strain NY0313808BC1" /LENGTH=321 /DNA_ID=CAMNT_0050662105 /DNA_START=473 /DNA_END=1438 /DNA_ORIENTATION=-